MENKTRPQYATALTLQSCCSRASLVILLQHLWLYVSVHWGEEVETLASFTLNHIQWVSRKIHLLSWKLRLFCLLVKPAGLLMMISNVIVAFLPPSTYTVMTPSHLFLGFNTWWLTACFLFLAVPWPYITSNPLFQWFSNCVLHAPLQTLKKVYVLN